MVEITRQRGGRQRQQDPEVSSDVSIDEEYEEAERRRRERKELEKMKKENREMRNKIRELEGDIERMEGEAESVRLDIIRRSQMNFDCEGELFKRIEEYAKKTLFRHIKFITSDEILNDLETKSSLANVTMDNFDVPGADRISWWRTCSIMVSDAISTQRNQVVLSIKAQVLSK
jgi:hypothetical protein